MEFSGVVDLPKRHIFKINSDDLLAADAAFKKIIPEHFQKSGFAASAYSGDNLDKRQVFETDQFIQIRVSFYQGNPP
jgi:hypothetical protein